VARPPFPLQYKRLRKKAAWPRLWVVWVITNVSMNIKKQGFDKDKLLEKGFSQEDVLLMVIKSLYYDFACKYGISRTITDNFSNQFLVSVCS